MQQKAHEASRVDAAWAGSANGQRRHSLAAPQSKASDITGTKITHTLCGHVEFLPVKIMARMKSEWQQL